MEFEMEQERSHGDTRGTPSFQNSTLSLLSTKDWFIEESFSGGGMSLAGRLLKITLVDDNVISNGRSREDYATRFLYKGAFMLVDEITV